MKIIQDLPLMLMLGTGFASTTVTAAEAANLDMSDPTEVYTYIGSSYGWHILDAGVVLTGANSQYLSPQVPASSRGGEDIASTVVTGTVYARYTITDKWWIVANTAYTGDVSVESWDDMSAQVVCSWSLRSPRFHLVIK
jgi:hypothetical protein